MTRIKEKFSELKKQQKSAFVAYICAGDPDFETSFEILKQMPKNHVDLIELGVPFLDPAGDGPVIEAASKRAIQNGMSLVKTLKMAEEFRKNDDKTPIILMGYYNNFLKFGIENFFLSAEKSGIDGVLIVDLPLEEREEVLSKKPKNIDFINLIAPMTDQARIAEICKNASGFLYMISMLGITGTKSAEIDENEKRLTQVRKITNLPICVGFGINQPAQLKKFANSGFDGVVVGSRIVKEIQENLDKPSAEIIEKTNKIIKEFGEVLK